MKCRRYWDRIPGRGAYGPGWGAAANVENGFAAKGIDNQRAAVLVAQAVRLPAVGTEAVAIGGMTQDGCALCFHMKKAL